MAMHQTAVRCRWIAAPKTLDDLVGRHDLVRLNCQQAEQDASAGPSDLERGGAAKDGQRSEHADAYPAVHRVRGAAGGGQESLPVGFGKPQGAHQAADGPGPGLSHPVSLDLAQRTHAEPGLAGQLQLAQASADPLRAYQHSECLRPLVHSHTSVAVTDWGRTATW